MDGRGMRRHHGNRHNGGNFYLHDSFFQFLYSKNMFILVFECVFSDFYGLFLNIIFISIHYIVPSTYEVHERHVRIFLLASYYGATILGFGQNEMFRLFHNNGRPPSPCEK